MDNQREINRKREKEREGERDIGREKKKEKERQRGGGRERDGGYHSPSIDK